MIETVIDIAREAGSRILKVYQQAHIAVREKADKSPVTDADMASHQYICHALESAFALPVLSEEGTVADSERLQWTSFWLVDPLDGTRDFLARNDMFTVNIALVRDRKPVLGVVGAPALDLYYYAEEGKGAFVIRTGKKQPIYNRRDDKNLICLESVHHKSSKTKEFCDTHGIATIRSYGSALKFGKLAEGEADVYPRFVQCWEWDTAAGHCVCNEAGCPVISLESGMAIEYNKQNIKNESFIAYRKGLESQLGLNNC